MTNKEYTVTLHDFNDNRHIMSITVSRLPHILTYDGKYYAFVCKGESNLHCKYAQTRMKALDRSNWRSTIEANAKLS